MGYKNPEIWKLAKNQTGPKTALGKLKVSQNAKKHSGKALQRSKDSLLMQQMAQTGEVAGLEDHNAYVTWLRSFRTRQLQEVVELENLHHLLKGEIIQSIEPKINNSEEFSKLDLLRFKLLQEILISLHKVKSGERHTNSRNNTAYNSLQEMLFGKLSKETND